MIFFKAFGGFALFILMQVMMVLCALGLKLILVEFELVSNEYAFGLSLFVSTFMMIPVAHFVQQGIESDDE